MAETLGPMAVYDSILKHCYMAGILDCHGATAPRNDERYYSGIKIRLLCFFLQKNTSFLPLHTRAEKRAATRLDDAADAGAGGGPGAEFAGLGFASVDFPGVLEIPEFAAGLAVVAQGGAAGRDRGGQRGTDGWHQAGGAGAGDAGRETAGGDAGGKEGFTDVDVA